MNRMWRMVGIGCLLIVLAPVGNAARLQPDAEFIKDIHRLQELTGTSKVADQLAPAVVSTVLQALDGGRGAMPPRTAKIVGEVVAQELKAAFAPSGVMADGLAAVYARYFTADEIRGLIAFYESSLGRKMVAAGPSVTQDKLKLALAWARERGPAMQKRIDERLRAEGITKRP